jgi:hypothetical protein
MWKGRWAVLFLLAGIFALCGCAAIVVGGAAVGAGSGTYIYVNGEMRTDYTAPFDRVWAAVEKTVAKMQGLDVERSKEIAQGTISAVIDDEKTYFSVKYKEKNLTTVSIRVGTIGSKLASQMLHDKISDNLLKK